MKKNVIMDSQILSTLMSCARLADFRFNMNLHQMSGKSNSLEVGSIVHKALEIYYRSLILGFNRQDAIQKGLEAGQLYAIGCKGCTRIETPECGHSTDEYPGVINTPQESEKYKVGWSWAIKTAEQYFEFYKNDSWTPLEVEIVRGEVLYEDDELRIMWKAIYDLIIDTHQGIFPTDHKTMKQNRDTVSMNNQFMGQCLLLKTKTIIINKIGFQTSLKPQEKFLRLPISYSNDRLLEWQSEILPYYAKLMLMYSEADYWPPNFTHCENKYGNCNFIGVCGSDKGMREEELKLNFIVGKKWDPLNEDD